MNRRTLLILVGLAIADLLISLWIGQQAYHWMPPQASAEALLVDHLFSFMTTLGSFIFLGVMGTLLYAVLFQRAAKYDTSDGPAIEGNVKLEVVWTAIPIVLVIWIATVSYQTYDRMGILGGMGPMAMGMPMAEAASVAPTEAEPAPINVYARQWAWEFHYPDPDIRSTELHLPVDQRARLLLSSEDVLHGFFIPAFRVKQDVVPGRDISFEFTPIRKGRYRLRDSEYSGTYFAANQTDVVVESAEDYQQWLATAVATPPFAAQNVAYEEFNQETQSALDLGWETVKPAPAPVVNYASSENDPHE
ncbi:cytochrome c oxidase subunit II [Acaryochloris sp. IP29b_bin.137]|uniref:cytochrome c oxidase subunit II n=1 Tax=Acaryochloris sp. IP29b_bin.137 TaxID=2969217 RepID=UPI002633A5D0|nr:cytochrome c oxidase subunit II [Acaryochloris sp. IP29b_bin.137]